MSEKQLNAINETFISSFVCLITFYADRLTHSCAHPKLFAIAVHSPLAECFIDEHFSFLFLLVLSFCNRARSNSIPIQRAAVAYENDDRRIYESVVRNAI